MPESPRSRREGVSTRRRRAGAAAAGEGEGALAAPAAGAGAQRGGSLGLGVTAGLKAAVEKLASAAAKVRATPAAPAPVPAAVPAAAAPSPAALQSGGLESPSASSGLSAGPRVAERKSDALSQYRGVAVHRYTGKWEAHIWEAGKQLYLGSFEREEQAARVYDRAAIKLKKENAVLNFEISEYEEELEHLARISKEDMVMELRRQSAGFSRGTAAFRGVTYRQQTGRWEARIGRLLGRKYTYLGTFKTGEEAARAYDRAAILTRGREAITNYNIDEYGDLLAQVERASPEERRAMEERVAIRPDSAGAATRREKFATAKGRKKAFAASTSKPDLGAPRAGGVQKRKGKEKAFKRSASAPAGKLGGRLVPAPQAASLQLPLPAAAAAAGTGRPARAFGRAHSLSTHILDCMVGDFFSGQPGGRAPSWEELVVGVQEGVPPELADLLFAPDGVQDAPASASPALAAAAFPGRAADAARRASAESAATEAGDPFAGVWAAADHRGPPVPMEAMEATLAGGWAEAGVARSQTEPVPDLHCGLPGLRDDELLGDLMRDDDSFGGLPDFDALLDVPHLGQLDDAAGKFDGDVTLEDLGQGPGFSLAKLLGAPFGAPGTDQFFLNQY